MMKNAGLYATFGVALAGIVALCLTVSAFVAQFAWNSFMPGVFGLPEISFWQALGLAILLSLVGKVASNGQSKG